MDTAAENIFVGIESEQAESKMGRLGQEVGLAELADGFGKSVFTLRHLQVLQIDELGEGVDVDCFGLIPDRERSLGLDGQPGAKVGRGMEQAG